MFPDGILDTLPPHLVLEDELEQNEKQGVPDVQETGDLRYHHPD